MSYESIVLDSVISSEKKLKRLEYKMDEMECECHHLRQRLDNLEQNANHHEAWFTGTLLLGVSLILCGLVLMAIAWQ